MGEEGPNPIDNFFDALESFVNAVKEARLRAEIDKLYEAVELEANELAKDPRSVSAIIENEVNQWAKFARQLVAGYRDYAEERYSSAVRDFGSAVREAPTHRDPQQFRMAAEEWKKKSLEKTDQAAKELDKQIKEMLKGEPSRENLDAALALATQGASLEIEPPGKYLFTSHMREIERMLGEAKQEEWYEKHKTQLLNPVQNSWRRIIATTGNLGDIDECLKECDRLANTYPRFAPEIAGIKGDLQVTKRMIEIYLAEKPRGLSALKAGLLEDAQGHLQRAYNASPEIVANIDQPMIELLNRVKEAASSWRQARAAWVRGDFDSELAVQDFNTVAGLLSEYPVYRDMAERARYRADPLFDQRIRELEDNDSLTLQGCIAFWKQAREFLSPDDTDSWSRSVWQKFAAARQSVVRQLLEESNQQKQKTTLDEIVKALSLYKKENGSDEYLEAERKHEDFMALQEIKTRCEADQKRARELVKRGNGLVRRSDSEPERINRNWKEAEESFRAAFRADQDNADASSAVGFFDFLVSAEKKLQGKPTAEEMNDIKWKLKKVEEELQGMPLAGEASRCIRYRDVANQMRRVEEDINRERKRARVKVVTLVVIPMVVLGYVAYAFGFRLPLFTEDGGGTKPIEVVSSGKTFDVGPSGDVTLYSKDGTRSPLPQTLWSVFLKQPGRYGQLAHRAEDNIYSIYRFENNRYLGIKKATGQVVEGEGYINDPDGTVRVYNSKGTDYYDLPKALAARYLEEPSQFGSFSRYTEYRDLRQLTVEFSSGRFLGLVEGSLIEGKTSR